MQNDFVFLTRFSMALNLKILTSIQEYLKPAVSLGLPNQQGSGMGSGSTGSSSSSVMPYYNPPPPPRDLAAINLKFFHDHDDTHNDDGQMSTCSSDVSHEAENGLCLIQC